MIHKTLGFTLIEVLVSLVIFSILTVIAYTGLDSILKTRQQVEGYTERLQRLERTFYFLGKDIEQSVLREIRNEIGEKQPALKSATTGDFRLELTHIGWRNPAQTQRSTVQRVAYRIEGENLFREYWTVLDRPQKADSQKALILDKVKNLSFLFYDKELKTHEAWPLLKTQGEKSEDSSEPLRRTPLKSELPRAVEVKIEFEDWGEFKRLFVLPEGK